VSIISVSVSRIPDAYKVVSKSDASSGSNQFGVYELQEIITGSSSQIIGMTAGYFHTEKAKNRYNETTALGNSTISISDYKKIVVAIVAIVVAVAKSLTEFTLTRIIAVDAVVPLLWQFAMILKLSELSKAFALKDKVPTNVSNVVPVTGA
jgi:Zn-dependent M16 (insulinase) family peptidase